jgi:glucokinase
MVEYWQMNEFKYMAKKAKNLAIAVDIGGTNLRVAIIDEKGKMIAKNIVKTIQKGRSGVVITEQVINEINKIIGKNKINIYKGIGVSAVGPIDLRKGAIANTPNISFGLIPVVGPLQKEFELPVIFLNDCNAGALGEKYFGAGKKYNNLVYVTMSSGIGGGAIVDGKLLLGKDGNAAEVGHTTVDTEYNLPCTCQKGRGHWEAYASGNNMPNFFQAWEKNKKISAKKIDNISAKEIFEMARRKNRIALSFMEELGKINGRGLSNIIVAYDPEIIILGGAVALHNGNIILKYAKKYVDHFLRLPKIEITSLGEDAPLLGAAAFFHKRS